MPDVQYPDDPSSDPSAIRIEDILAGDDDATPPAPAAPVREGLPRSFRMRADKHYVEMLDAPPKQGGEAAPAAGARQDEPGDLAAAAAAAQAGRDLAQSLASLLASTNLLSDRGPALASTVAGNLIRAEAWRATCLLRVSRFLRGELKAAAKPVRAYAIVEQLLKSIEPERRLRGITIDTRVNVGDKSIAVDEDLLVTALSGLLTATVGLTEEPSAFSVTISAETRGSEVVFGIAQDQVPAPANWGTGTYATGASRIAASFKGRVTANASGGTDIRLIVPRV